MAAFNKFNGFADALAKGQVNLSADTVKVMLTNTAPLPTNSKYSDVSGNELANGNGYTTGGVAAAGLSVTNSNGTESCNMNAVTFTSSTGSMGPFRYIVVYDSSTGVLIGWYDYGQSVTLNGASSETFLVQPANGVLFTLA